MKRRKQTELSHPNFVAVRLSDTEMAILDQACASLGTTHSEYLRRLLTEKEICNNIEIVADIKLLRDLVGQYGKIGSNLNQLAKYFNTKATGIVPGRIPCSCCPPYIIFFTGGNLYLFFSELELLHLAVLLTYEH